MAAVVVAGVVLLPALSRAAEVLRFKPGFNLFSPQKDVEIGKESGVQVEKEVPLL